VKVNISERWRLGSSESKDFPFTPHCDTAFSATVRYNVWCLHSQNTWIGLETHL